MESLTSADSSGVGASAGLPPAAPPGAGGRPAGASHGPGRSTPKSSPPPLPTPGTTPRFATPDPFVVLAEPDGVAARRARPVGRRRRLAPRSRRRSRWPSSSSGPARAADPRVRQVSSADYADSRGRGGAGLDHRHRSSRPAHNGLPLGRRHRGRGRRHARPARVQRRPRARRADPDEAMDDAVERATRMLGATKAQSVRCTVVFDPRVVSTLIAVVASALSGEAVVKGRSFFAGRLGESVGDAGGHVGRRPDRRPGLRRGLERRRRSGLPAQRADRRRACCGCSSTTPSRLAEPAPSRRDRRCAAASPGRPAGCRALVLSPGRGDGDEILADGRRRPLRAVGHRHPLGRQPGERRLLGGRRGPDDPRRRPGQPVREVTVASTLQRMLQSIVDDRWRSALAPRLGGGSDPRDRGDAAVRRTNRRRRDDAGRAGGRGGRLGVLA